MLKIDIASDASFKYSKLKINHRYENPRSPSGSSAAAIAAASDCVACSQWLYEMHRQIAEHDGAVGVAYADERQNQ
jgi:hypothetical protein